VPGGKGNPECVCISSTRNNHSSPQSRGFLSVGADANT
jgi:hypothetical protein